MRINSELSQSIDPKTDRSSIHKYHITMGSQSRRDTWKRSSRRRSKRSTERRNSPYRNISPTALDSMDKRKTRTRTARKKRKLDHNYERAQNTPHNEQKHQNDDQTRAGCHKPLTHWIYPTHPFYNDGQRTQPGMPFLRSKSHHRPHSMLYGIVRKRKRIQMDITKEIWKGGKQEMEKLIKYLK
jgi:hypothetical protein